MTILLTGGNGNTSTAISALFTASNTPHLRASRSSPVKFDWDDESTFPALFENQQITAVYIVVPTVPEPAPIVQRFIDLAISKGVKRFVLLGGSLLKKGGPNIGTVWAWLEEQQGKVEWAVLLPTWFMETFSSNSQSHYSTLKKEAKFYTATKEGKVPFVAVKDIARVAAHALTDAKPHNEAYFVTGPELLSLDEIAEKLSKGVGKKIEHVKLSEEERVQSYIALGEPEARAKFLTFLEGLTAQGSEEGHPRDAVERITGSKGLTFDEWIVENKEKLVF